MKKPLIVIVMGSESDFPVMKKAAEILRDWKITHDVLVVSAHRTPHLMEKSVGEWEKNGIKVIIAGAGGAAHLPGMLASYSVLPVIGVPIKTKAMHGLDSLLSIAQMPRGIPVATVAVDNAENAALLALEILGTFMPQISTRMRRYKKQLEKKVLDMRKSVRKLSLKR